MYSHRKALDALERKRGYFTRYWDTRSQEQRQIDHFLETFRRESSASIWQALQGVDDNWPGALPSDEIDDADGLRLPFVQTWSSHQDAAGWALATLYNRPVIAVDGSQITPTQDFSVPVGAVQIGWFVNEHREANGNGADNYVKDIHFEILAPDELGGGEGENEPFPDWRVNQERFILECAKLCELIERYAERPVPRRPLCFFDGSLVISFAAQLRTGRDLGYIRSVRRLLDCSAAGQTPLVGFVDSAYSRDVVTLIQNLYGAHLGQTSDAELFASVLPGWGDRSPFFICARPDGLSRNGKADFYKEIAFCYVRLVQDRPPARLEIPRWLLEAGRADAIVDLVRAECVVGRGYPYALETADVTAVIRQPDRERFYKLFQEFLDEEGIPLSVARKMRSKRSRR